MAQQQPSTLPESSRFPRAPQPIFPTDDPLEQVGTPSRDVAPTHVLPVDRDISGPPSAAPGRVVSQRPLPMDVNAFGLGNAFRDADEESHDAHFNDTRMDATRYDDGQPQEARAAEFSSEYSAPRRQARAEDDVHYTTSPFRGPRSAAPLDAGEKRGLGSRAMGTACLAASAVFGAAALALTVLMQVYIAVPTFLIAGALFYAGRGSLRDSAEKLNQSNDSDPGRRREPDIGD